MSEQRIVVETLCEHREWDPHLYKMTDPTRRNHFEPTCPGCSRRIVELPDMEKLKDMVRYWNQIDRTDPRRISLSWQQLDDLLDAARWVLNLTEVE